MRAGWWWALIIATIPVVAAVVVFGSGSGGDDVAGSEPVAAPVVGIDVVRTTSSGLEVVGWVTHDEPVVVRVDTDRVFTEVVADQLRFDRRVAASGASTWGFVAELPLADRELVCATHGDEQACRPIGCVQGVFAEHVVADLRDEHPGVRVTAQVVDTRTGCRYDLEPGLVLTVASVVKLEVLGLLLSMVQQEGRPLSEWERARAEEMMQFSLNDATAALYRHVGGVAALERHSRSLGARDTAHTARFGATASTAADRNLVVAEVLGGSGALDWEHVELAWEIMRGVVPAQSWGASAGVPTGWDVAAKTGFYPYQQFRWRVGTTGFVSDPAGGGYAVTIMTDGNVDQAQGVEIVESLAAHVAWLLAGGEAAPRAFDEVDCITHVAGSTWPALAAELGLSPGAAEAVRLGAGGDGPLRGHLVCSP